MWFLYRLNHTPSIVNCILSYASSRYKKIMNFFGISMTCTEMQYSDKIHNLTKQMQKQNRWNKQSLNLSMKRKLQKNVLSETLHVAYREPKVARTRKPH